MTDTFDLRQYTNLQDRVLTALGTQLSELGKEINRRLDIITDDSRKVGERLARIEGVQAGSPQELQSIKDDLDEIQSDVKQAYEKANRLENRVTRLETMIVPAACILSAIFSALAEHFIK